MKLSKGRKAKGDAKHYIIGKGNFKGFVGNKRDNSDEDCDSVSYD